MSGQKERWKKYLPAIVLTVCKLLASPDLRLTVTAPVLPDHMIGTKEPTEIRPRAQRAAKIGAARAKPTSAKVAVAMREKCFVMVEGCFGIPLVWEVEMRLCVLRSDLDIEDE